MRERIRKELVERFERKRTERKEEALKRRYELYTLDKRFQEIDDAIRDSSESFFLASQDEPKESLEEALNELLERKGEERKKLLKIHGLPEDYLDIHYDCTLCNDTGTKDGKDCLCFKRELSKELYRSEDLTGGRGPNLEEWTADIFRDPTQRQETLSIYTYTKRYFERFQEEPGKSMIFYGPSGLGKTYLLNALAKSLSEKGYYVIYQSAPELFKVDFKMLPSYRDELLSADLIVIDDLGKEYLSEHFESEFFQLINSLTRMQKSFVISTNLTLDNLRKRYGDAIFQRFAMVSSVHEFAGKEVRSAGL
ncbi:ATP-binding protein [Guggenheimella bovis]